MKIPIFYHPEKNSIFSCNYCFPPVILDNSQNNNSQKTKTKATTKNPSRITYVWLSMDWKKLGFLVKLESNYYVDEIKFKE